MQAVLKLLQSRALHPVRCVWRRLLRYAAVRHAVEAVLLYPRLSHIRHQADAPDGPLLIAGFFTASHGIGEAARLELARQRELDPAVLGVDISPAFGLQELPTPDGVVDRAAAPCHGPLVVHCNAPEAARALVYLGKRLTSGRRIIGYWAWELETPPRSWHRAYPYLDALWVPSRHTAKAFAGAPIPVFVHPHVVKTLVDGGHSRVELGVPAERAGDVLFLCMADGRSDLKRKNIMGTVSAFAQACGGRTGVCLLVKLQHCDEGHEDVQRICQLAAAYDNIVVLQRTMTASERNSLLHRADVVVSLHRAEGFGLLLAEALHLHKTIIATDYSGSCDFLHAGNSLLVPYALVPVDSGNLNYCGYANAVWADPDLNAASRAMTRAAEQHGVRL